jgi:hypothetical protein
MAVSVAAAPAVSRAWNWSTPCIFGHDWAVNDESLRRANAFLGAVVERVQVGEVLRETPAEIGRDLGMPDALSTARAVRALIARRRLEPAQGSYRLLDGKPVEADERESIGRRPRSQRAARRSQAGGPAVRGDRASYSDLGRAVADKLIDLGKEVAQLRASLREAREESRESRAARDEAETRARTLSERSKELEARAEMAETNLRALLATARGRDVKPDAKVGDAEMAAILGVLKGDEGEEGEQVAQLRPAFPEPAVAAGDTDAD